MFLPLIILQSAPIVVTGKPLEQPDAALNGIVISHDDLDLSPAVRLEDVLTAIPDLQTFRRADSDSTHPTSAGLTARGLGGNAASRMLVVVDGVPQNDPFGGWIAWPALSPLRIGRIEVDRGNGQARWGNGALAGTVEVDSLSPDDAKGADVVIEAGSRRSLYGAGRVLVGSPDAYLVVAGEGRRSDGFVPVFAEDRGAADRRAPYAQWSGLVRGAVRLAPAVELQAGLQRFRDRRTRGLDFSANRTDGLDTSVRLVGRGRHPFQISVFRQARRFASQFAATDADRSESRLVLDQDDVPGRAWGARGEVDLIHSADSILRIGGDLRRGEGHTHEYYLFTDSVASRERAAGGDFGTSGLFVEASKRWKGWQAGASFRLDWWTLDNGRLSERALAGDTINDVAFARRAGLVPGGRISLRRSLDMLQVEVAAYRGWRLPTLNELYRPYRVGADAFAPNAALEPEELLGGEISASSDLSPRWSTRATLFVEHLRNPVVNVTLGEGPGVFPGVGYVAPGGHYSRRLNASALDSRGVEAGVDWHASDWQVGMSAAFVRARIHDEGAAKSLEGRPPAQVPAMTTAFKVRWSPRPGMGADLSVLYRSRVSDDDLGLDHLPGAITANVSAAWPIARQLSLRGSIENLLDARVQTAVAAGGARERTTPRTVWLGLSLRE